MPRALVVDNLSGLTTAYDDGVLLFSADAGLVNEAIATNGHAGLMADGRSIDARASFGAGADAHVVIHLGRAHRALQHWFAAEQLAEMEGSAGWVALDVRIRPDALLANGFFFQENAETTSVEAPAMRFSVPRVLPPVVHAVWQSTIAALPMPSADAPQLAHDLWTLAGVVATAVAGEVDSLRLNWAVLHAEDPLQAQALLMARTEPGDTLAYRGVRMERMRDTSALAAAWGARFEQLERPWWCMLGDKLVFGSSVQAMRLAIDTQADGSSLAQQASSGLFFQRYATDAQQTWWFDAVPALSAGRPQWKQAGRDLWSAHPQAWERLGACMLQRSPERSGVQQVTLCVSATGTGAASVAATGGAPVPAGSWSVALGASVAHGPWILTDHISRTKQVLVQDDRHRVALISCTGKLLWRRDLDGPVLGDVHQVDRYKNGKLQMLFNTARSVYLIDRNGKDVEHFPHVLAETAGAPLNVFDYDGKKEYRVLIPTVEARLLNIDLNAKAVEGWVPPRTKNVCALPVQHLRIRGKDHLVLIDTDGHAYVIDRRGAARYDAKLALPEGHQPYALLPALDIADCRALVVDADGAHLAGRFGGGLDRVAPADTANVEGIMRYPAAGGTYPTSLTVDLDLDGHPDLITAGADDRIVVQPAP